MRLEAGGERDVLGWAIFVLKEARSWGGGKGILMWPIFLLKGTRNWEEGGVY